MIFNPQFVILKQDQRPTTGHKKLSSGISSQNIKTTAQDVGDNFLKIKTIFNVRTKLRAPLNLVVLQYISYFTAF